MMVTHYLKIAWRNLLKYKTQSVVSIAGLAIGFTAFSFTMSWIRYERGFDKHIPDAERVYKVLRIDEKREHGVQFQLPAPMKNYLENLPEVEAVTAVQTARGQFSNNIQDARVMLTDTSFFKVFYPHIHISYPAELPDDHEHLIFSEKAAQLTGLDRTDIGQNKKTDEREFTLLDIVSGLPDKQTNVPFDVMTVRHVKMDGDCPWCYFSGKVYVRLWENANVETLAAKIDTLNIEGAMQGEMHYILVPLRKTHFIYPEDEARIKYNHLWVFTMVSVLVILCAFFNYLMLFINKIKLRSRELALRKVNGASDRKLMILLLTEIGVVLLSSLFIGAVLTEMLQPSFVKLSEIEVTKQFLLGEMLFYGIVVLCFSLVSALLLVHFFARKSIAAILQPEMKAVGRNKNRISIASLFIQLIVGTLLIFCTSIFFGQYKKLNSTDVGFNRFHINTFQSRTPFTKDEIRKIAGVEEVIYFYRQFLPRAGRSSFTYKTDTEEMIDTEIFGIHEPDFIDFFNMNILEGRNFHEGEFKVCLINETAKRKFGFTEPIGKIINDMVVIGVIADMYIDAPSLPVLPAVYRLREYMEHPKVYKKNPDTGEYEYVYEEKSNNIGFQEFAYKYLPGTKESTEQVIKEMAVDNGGEVRFTNLEEVYAAYTQSEHYLLILLGIMTSVAILIAVFGIYSMVTLACSRRRREIAIRKVNGAKAKEIFLLFFREYFAVTLISCLVAFPMGIYVMQRWLEQYTRRIQMEWWIFVGITVLVLLIVLTSIFFRVNKAARENPAEVVKGE